MGGLFVNIRRIKQITNERYKVAKGKFEKEVQIERLEKYASIIDSVMTSYNKKSCAETMMVKSYRSSSQETTIRKTHMEDHANLVAFAAEEIGLNKEVAVIMSKHHDIGHTFLGHSGEWWISNIKEDYGMGYDVHNAIGVTDLKYRYRIEDEIIERIQQVEPQISQKELKRIRESIWLILDGILSHNGEMPDTIYIPDVTKTEEQFTKEHKHCYSKKKFDKKIVPATTEACLMKLCDKISYIPSDMVDGLREGFIKELDEEYIDILKRIGIAEKEIQWSNAKKNYDAIAKKIKMIFITDLIKNSNKNKISMSKEMSLLMNELLNKNNKEIVNDTVMKEDLLVYKREINQLMYEYGNFLLESVNEQETVLDRLETIYEDEEFSKQLIHAYETTPDIGFIRYISDMPKEQYHFIQETVEEAMKESIKEELQLAKEIAKEGKEVKFTDQYRYKNKRVLGYVAYLREKFPGNKAYTSKELEEDSEVIFHNLQQGNHNPNYVTLKEGIALEVASQYVANLNDKEFMDLLLSKQLVTEARYSSLTRKYKDFKYKDEVGRQPEWIEIKQMQEDSLGPEI